MSDEKRGARKGVTPQRTGVEFRFFSFLDFVFSFEGLISNSKDFSAKE
jgi:hypothetical protein